jgi:hypothetical protein
VSWGSRVHISYRFFFYRENLFTALHLVLDPFTTSLYHSFIHTHTHTHIHAHAPALLGQKKVLFLLPSRGFLLGVHHAASFLPGLPHVFTVSICNFLPCAGYFSYFFRILNAVMGRWVVSFAQSPLPNLISSFPHHLPLWYPYLLNSGFSII